MAGLNINPAGPIPDLPEPARHHSKRPVLGVAMLDTAFPRPPGDIGNMASFDFPVIHHRVPGASVRRAVTDTGPDDDLVNAFVTAGRALMGRGATIIATSCGFLAPLQPRMTASLPVPVVTSSLIDLAAMRARIGDGPPIGILTFDSTKLGAAHLPPEFGPYRVCGVESGQELHPVISGNLPNLDLAAARIDVANAATHLLATGPLPAAIMLECTNLPPYKDVITAIFDGPVYDIRDAINCRVAHGTFE